MVRVLKKWLCKKKSPITAHRCPCIYVDLSWNDMKNDEYDCLISALKSWFWEIKIEHCVIKQKQVPVLK